MGLYFRNLDGMRFIAAAFVIIGHCQHVMLDPPFKIKTYSPWAEKLAGFGVDFFFVLSGFLISYFLIKELYSSNSINIKRFYFRRILRLWPLYFLSGITGLVTAGPILNWVGILNQTPDIGAKISNFLYLFFFAINFQTLLGQMNDYSSAIVGHFWSLAVEEQFYLIWAPLLLVFRKHLYLMLFLVCAGGYTTTIHQPDVFTNWFHENAPLSPVFFTTNRFFHFGLGAFIALLVEKKLLSELPAFVSITLQVAFILPALNYLFGHHFYPIAPERIVNGLISAGLILMAIARHSIFPFEIAWLKYLGKISFGIYIFHMFSIRICFKLLADSGLHPERFEFHLLFPLVSAIIAVTLASASYELIEKRFLAMKERYK